MGFILSGVVVMFLAAWFVKRSQPFFSRKMETVDAMVPYDDPVDIKHDETVQKVLKDVA